MGVQVLGQRVWGAVQVRGKAGLRYQGFIEAGWVWTLSALGRQVATDHIGSMQ